MRAVTAHAACPISQLAFITIFFIGGSGRHRRQGMRAGSPTLGKWDKKFWMIALDAFSIKSFGMAQLFIHISEKKNEEIIGNLRVVVYVHYQATLRSMFLLEHEIKS
jgi:hypothetical protein